MNILCDQCVNRDVVEALRQADFNAIHASEVGLSRVSDQEVFTYAQRSRRVLLTFDHGFGNITQFPIRNSTGIVVIYIAEMTKETVIARTLHIFKNLLKKRPAAGRLFIVETETIRIWPK